MPRSRKLRRRSNPLEPEELEKRIIQAQLRARARKRYKKTLSISAATKNDGVGYMQVRKWVSKLRPCKKHFAERFLFYYLSNGPKIRPDILRKARAHGIRERSLERAASKIGIKRENQISSGKFAPAVWFLDGSEQLSSCDICGSEKLNMKKKKKIHKADELLLNMLAKGPLPRPDIIRAGKHRQVSESTIERAASRLGIIRKIERNKGKISFSMWSLPALRKLRRRSNPLEPEELEKRIIQAQLRARARRIYQKLGSEKKTSKKTGVPLKKLRPWIQDLKRSKQAQAQKLVKELIKKCDDRIMGQKGISNQKIVEIVQEELGKKFSIKTINNWRKGKPSILFGKDGEPGCLSPEQRLAKKLILSCDDRILYRGMPSSKKIADVINKELGLKVGYQAVYFWRKGRHGKHGILFGEKEEPSCGLTPEQRLAKQLILDCDPRILGTSKGPSSPKIAAIIKKKLGTDVSYNNILFWRKGGNGKPSILFGEDGEPSCGLLPEQQLVKQLILDCDPRILGERGPSNEKIANVIRKKLRLNINPGKINRWRKGRYGKPSILFGEKGEPPCLSPEKQLAKQFIIDQDDRIMRKGKPSSQKIVEVIEEVLGRRVSFDTVYGWIKRGLLFKKDKDLRFKKLRKYRKNSIFDPHLSTSRHYRRNQSKFRRRSNPIDLEELERRMIEAKLRARARRLYREGARKVVIKKQLYIEEATLNKWLKGIANPRMQKAKKLYKSGSSRKQIQKQLHVGDRLLNKWLKGIANPRMQKAKKLYKSGSSRKQIQKQLHVGDRLLNKWLKGIANPRMQKAKELYRSGISRKQIQKRLHVGDRLLNKWLGFRPGLRRRSNPLEPGDLDRKISEVKLRAKVRRVYQDTHNKNKTKKITGATWDKIRLWTEDLRLPTPSSFLPSEFDIMFNESYPLELAFIVYNLIKRYPDDGIIGESLIKSLNIKGRTYRKYRKALRNNFSEITERISNKTRYLIWVADGYQLPVIRKLPMTNIVYAIILAYLLFNPKGWPVTDLINYFKIAGRTYRKYRNTLSNIEFLKQDGMQIVEIEQISKTGEPIRVLRLKSSTITT
jgi:transposase